MPTSAASLLLLVALAAPTRESRLDASRHNFFGAGNPSPDPSLDLCQFCHVPNRLQGMTAQLWAPDAPPQAAALDVRADPHGVPQPLRFAGSTLRCLSCHDTTVSRIGIAFRPSSASLRSDPVAADRHRTEAAGDAYLGIPEDWGWSGRVMANHPVGVPYPLGSAGYRLYNPRANPLAAREWVPDPRVNGLKLFTDQSGFDIPPGGAGIECASCHDPHGTPYKPFLRLPKAGSVLCLGCHRK